MGDPSSLGILLDKKHSPRLTCRMMLSVGLAVILGLFFVLFPYTDMENEMAIFTFWTRPY